MEYRAFTFAIVRLDEKLALSKLIVATRRPHMTQSGHPTYVTQSPKKSTQRESAISNRYTDIVACSSRNVAMMASGSMRSRNSILTCRAATSPSRPTINLAAIGRK